MIVFIVTGQLSLTCNLIVLSNVAQSVDVFVECLAVDGAGAHGRLVIVNGLGGVEQQCGYLLAVCHAKAH